MTGTSEGGATSVALPDLAWVVRPGENEELRYSLRSVAQNAEGLYRKIWIVGQPPSWLRNVETIRLNPLPNKWDNIRQSLEAVANNSDVADKVLIFNDDHFLMRPISKWQMFHRGSTSRVLRELERRGVTPGKNSWVRGVKRTWEWLKEAHEISDATCYENHTPLLFNRAKLAAALDEYPKDSLLAYPGLYVLAGAGGKGIRDGNAKVAELDAAAFRSKGGLKMPWLSTEDKSFENGFVGGWIQAHFQDPSPYEG